MQLDAKLSNKEVKGNNIPFETICKEMPLGMAVCEVLFNQNVKAIDFRFIHVNLAFEIQTELSTNDLLGNSWKEVSGCSDDDLLIQKFGAVVKSKKPIQILYHCPITGKYYEVNAFYVGQNRVVKILNNITEKHVAEVAFKESAEKFEKILDPMHEMHVLIELVYNDDGKAIDYNIIKVNPAFEKLTDSNKSNLEGKSAKSMFGDLIYYWLDQFETIDKLGEPIILEQYMKELDKHINNSAWKVGERKIALIATDISKRKAEEQELIRAKEEAKESSRLKSAFLANMSHEIRTPMNGILGFASLLQDPNITTAEQLQYTSIIQSSGKRMLGIINDIVDISKIESGSMEVFLSKSNINDQLEYLFTFFKPEVENKNIHFFYKCGLNPIDSIILTDREKIFAILTNLIKNAIKNTEKGSIEFGYVKKEGHLEFYVKDTGIGISQKEQEIIFERFMQGEKFDNKVVEGTGLGLAISKAYTEMLNGAIWVESISGSGSTFKFSIPYNQEGLSDKKESANPKKTDEDLSTKRLKILIADDDPTSNYLLSIILRQKFHNIIQVKNGQEAVDVCRSEDNIDLVLMDLRMPILNGYLASEQIRSFNKEVVIIAQTAFGLSGDKEKAIAAGCNDYLAKPIEKAKLLEMIKKYFEDNSK